MISVCRARQPELLASAFARELVSRFHSFCFVACRLHLWLIARQSVRIEFVTNWLWNLARSYVTMSEVLGLVRLPAILRAPELWSHRGVDPVLTCGLTRRAADLGYAPRFLSVFVTLGFSRFNRESTLPPQVG